MNYESHPISQNRPAAYGILFAAIMAFLIVVVGAFFITP